MKQITINIPDNCELKLDGNTYTVVEKEHRLNYDNIAEKLFPTPEMHYYITNDGTIIDNYNSEENRNLKNNALSKRQLEKLLAINKLMNVAKYLNGGWQPDWDYIHEMKWYIFIKDKQIRICYADDICCNNIYFKSRELVEKAIEILGEETIKLALCTDY